MNFQTILLNCILLASSYTTAYCQSGCGGGILIQTIIDKHGVVVHSDDPALILRTFVLSDYEGSSIRPSHLLTQEASCKRTSSNQGRLYILPYSYHHGEKVKAPDQLIQFIYRGDTTSFEFRDIAMPNGEGNCNRIDTLQFIPGNHRYYFSPIKRYRFNLLQERDAAIYDSILQVLAENNGITEHSVPILRKMSLFETLGYKVQPIVFLDEDLRFDTTYLVRKPLYYLKTDAFQVGDMDIKLTIDDSPLINDSVLLYRCWLMVPALDVMQEVNQPDKRYTKASSLLKNLSLKRLYINQQLYSGVLKIFTPFSALVPGAGHIGGQGLSIYTFKNGVLIKEQHVSDVDLEAEQPLKRLV